MHFQKLHLCMLCYIFNVSINLNNDLVDRPSYCLGFEELIFIIKSFILRLLSMSIWSHV